MLLNLFEYHWVEDVDDALMLLSRSDVKTVALAGGTYLLGLNDDTIQAVVDLRDLELAYIIDEPNRLRVGAMTTLQTLIDDPVGKNFAWGVLARAAQASSASRLIRSAATIGGTLGAGVASQADLLTVLAVLDAEVVLRSGTKTQVDLPGGTYDRPGLALTGVTYKGKQERRVPYHLYNSDRRASELILELAIPQPGPGYGASFLRIGRTPTDCALLNAAALVEIADGSYQRVRLALGGVNMETVRLQNVEKRLEGQSVGDKRLLFEAIHAGMSEFQPPTDFRASNGYRRVSGTSMAYRALEEAINMSRWQDITSSEGRA